MALPPTIAGLPPLTWLNNLPGDATVDGAGNAANLLLKSALLTGQCTLTMRAGEKTDWFNPLPVANAPAGLANAPALVFAAPAGQDWQLSARVTVQHKYCFDAGVLFVHQGKDDWCKLCFERSPEGKNLVVSVVTREISDDANGALIDGDSVDLRVSRCGPVIAFHYSTDGGSYWTLHRLFSMRDPNAPYSIGFLAQSPTGQQCTAHFTRITHGVETLADFRDGR